MYSREEYCGLFTYSQGTGNYSIAEGGEQNESQKATHVYGNAFPYDISVGHICTIDNPDLNRNK